MKKTMILRSVFDTLTYKSSSGKVKVRCYGIVENYSDGSNRYLISKCKSYNLNPIYFDDINSYCSFVKSKGWQK